MRVTSTANDIEDLSEKTPQDPDPGTEVSEAREAFYKCGPISNIFNLSENENDLQSALNSGEFLNLQKWLGLHQSEVEVEGGSKEDDWTFQELTSFDGSNSNPNIYLGSSIEGHCPYSHDGVLCWPPTVMGEMASLPCMEKLRDILYNTSGTATRLCDLEGNWEKTNYTGCEHVAHSVENSTVVSDPTTVAVYFYGYGFSLVALVVAAIIFSVFKELHCLRNTIHLNLIATYVFYNALWMVFVVASEFSSYSQALPGVHEDRATCVTFLLLIYGYLSHFFWTFVEGLYLYVLVVKTFMAESIKLRTYCAIGWGIPFFIVIIWSIVRWLTMNPNNDVGQTLEVQNTFSTLTYRQLRDLDMNFSCPWIHENTYDWIHKASVLICLAANTIFLLQIMWVLITKLRSATTPETQQSRKAAKALIVLMPLLGITYILVLIGPRKVPEYEHIRAFVISMQGFLVALFFCFLNHEVRMTVRHRWNRMKCSRFECTCCETESEQDRRQNPQQTRDWSPRSRTESIRLYTPTGHTFRKRESSASDATTMTAILGSTNGNGGQNIIMSTPGIRRQSSTPFHPTKPSHLSPHNDETAFV